MLIEQAEATGELLEYPLLWFSVLYGFWVASYVEFNGDVSELAAQSLAHRMMGISLFVHRHVAECRPHYDQAIAT